MSPDLEDAGAPLAEAEAVRFIGTWEESGDWIFLHPTEDLNITLRVRAVDVTLRDQVPYVRVGAKVKATIPEDSPVLDTRGSATHDDCESGGTYCLGGNEICCESGETVGSCKGYWSCP